MSHPEYQVSVAGGLSRAYTVDKLRQKRNAGHIVDDAQCTPDGGQTWLPLGAILHDAAPAPQPRQAASASTEPGELSASESSLHRQKFDAPPAKMTAEKMFEQRGRVTPNSLRDDRSSSSSGLVRPMTVAASSESYTSGAHAAAETLEILKRKRAESRARNEQQNSVPFLHTESEKVSFRRAFSAGALGGILVSALCAVVIFLRSDSNFADTAAFPSLPSGGDRNATLRDGKIQPLTPEQLTKHVRIIEAQLSYLAREMAVEVDGIPVPQTLKSLPDVGETLLPFIPKQRTEAQTSELESLFLQYARVVQTHSADGRTLTQRAVDLHSRNLMQMMALPGTADSTREEAAHDLAEKYKLLYLLQLFNTRAADPHQQAQGRELLRNAGNLCLEQLYLEFASGDLGYMDIFPSASPAVQPELILLRYWYYRAVDRSAANEWLDRMQLQCSAVYRSYLRKSITEVDAIE